MTWGTLILLFMQAWNSISVLLLNVLHYMELHFTLKEMLRQAVPKSDEISSMIRKSRSHFEILGNSYVDFSRS